MNRRTKSVEKREHIQKRVDKLVVRFKISVVVRLMQLFFRVILICMVIMKVGSV